MPLPHGVVVRLCVLVTALAVAAGCAGADAPAPGTAPTAPPAAPPAARPAAPAAEQPGYRASGAGVPSVITHGPAGRRRIALTFDADMTEAMLRRLDAHQVETYANPAVIDELQAADVPATFFLTGLWARRYPDQVRRLAADSRFELASHSWDHRGFTASCYGLGTLPVAEMAGNVERSFAELAPFGGRQTRYFRFPGGCYDTAALRAVAPSHVTVVQWDDVGGDPFSDDPAAIAAAALKQAHDGAIVVLHMTKGTAPRTADALPTIVDTLRARGFTLVRLSELLHATS